MNPRCSSEISFEERQFLYPRSIVRLAFNGTCFPLSFFTHRSYTTNYKLVFLLKPTEETIVSSSCPLSIVDVNTVSLRRIQSDGQGQVCVHSEVCKFLLCKCNICRKKAVL